MNTDSELPIDPFKHIALSLSGGGVRAVGYHLGVLDYLNRTGLLPQVHTLSSVSGGSLVAIGYALSLKQGESFQEFHDNICEFLPELNTFEELLKSLDNRTPPVASGSRTMITALAEVYREKFFKRYFDDPTFGVFWNEEPDIHLKEIIINATEFKSGIAFRFQKSQFASVIGNGKISLDERYAKDILMSDILAASSCIPGGMEPLMFPQDFHWPDDEWARRGRSKRPYCDEVEGYLRDRYGASSVPLMDGGVYDNQGISSIVLTLARQHRGSAAVDEDSDVDELAGLEPVRPHGWARWLLGSMEKASATENQKDMGEVDLFIVSDTPIRKDPMYAAKPIDRSWSKGFKGSVRRLQLGTISNWVTGLTVVLIVSFIVTVIRFPDAIGWGNFIKNFEFDIGSISLVVFTGLTLILPLLLLGLSISALFGIRIYGDKVAEAALDDMPPMKRKLWDYAKKLRVGQLWDMATLRATSLTALSARIFMNRIRQLGYSLLYSHEEFEKRIMDNDINTLILKRTGEIPDLAATSDEVQVVVQRAASMGTKLWIDKPARERNDLDVLIAAGHISTCFNLIKYLWRCHRDENGELHAHVRPLYAQAESDWSRLNEDPFSLVDKRKNVGRAPGGLFWDQQDAYRKIRWYSRRRRKAG